jgi:hypothetical protein
MGFQERKRLKRIRDYVIIRDGLICCYCEVPLTEETVTMDHIVPESKRGTFNTTNLTVACSECNNKRGDIPFFEYCKQFNFPVQKLIKYKKLYALNLKIKILNIAKEECLQEDVATPIVLISKACKILKISAIDFSDYEDLYNFDISFVEACDRKKIKYTFEQLIRLIELDAI